MMLTNCGRVVLAANGYHVIDGGREDTHLEEIQPFVVLLAAYLHPQGLVDVGRIPSESGDAPTPLPYDRILVLVMVLLGDTICMSVILPFVPFMVKGFLRGPEHDIGYYSGLLGAAYQLGQLCFPFWGAISDRVGRRPVMLGCLSASCVWLLLFGLAPSLTFAVVCRFAPSTVQWRTRLFSRSSGPTRSRLTFFPLT